MTKINVLCTMGKLQEVKENPNSKLVEYDTETTHVIWHELDWVLYIQDLIQL